ncbi:MAG: SMI1/KNR4 family protein [Cupriavidus sp.]|nr:MAG: SMI1/KNR4 family protein [Cupriavidus sp.]
MLDRPHRLVQWWAMTWLIDPRIVVQDRGKVHRLALAALEEETGPLPADYREFVRRKNGMELSKNALVSLATAEGSKPWPLRRFYGIKDDMKAAGVHLQMWLWQQFFPAGSIPVGEDGEGNTFVMGLHGSCRGKIYFFSGEDSPNDFLFYLPKVADSFAHFLTSLHHSSRA